MDSSVDRDRVGHLGAVKTFRDRKELRPEVQPLLEMPK